MHVCPDGGEVRGRGRRARAVPPELDPHTFPMRRCSPKPKCPRVCERTYAAKPFLATRRDLCSKDPRARTLVDRNARARSPNRPRGKASVRCTSSRLGGAREGWGRRAPGPAWLRHLLAAGGARRRGGVRGRSGTRGSGLVPGTAGGCVPQSEPIGAGARARGAGRMAAAKTPRD